MYRYPLQTDNFSFFDRCKAALFLLNKKNRLTSGPKVLELESEWEKITNFKTKCIATSSGSTANHLLVETFIQSLKINPADIEVFVPSTTWASSITPWIMRGCKIIFIDINLEDFSFNYTDLQNELEKRKNNNKVKVIWPTALIGFIPDISKLNRLKNGYNKTYIFADLCETTIGEYRGENILNCFDMVTTSFFWAHEICGIEMGMLFINNNFLDNNSFENALMIRSHGLSRVLPKNNSLRKAAESFDHKIDPEFLFDKIGTNYRATDLNAFFALMDSKRYSEYKESRSKIWKYFLNNLPNQYEKLNQNIIPFCLPIISSKVNIRTLKKVINKNGWETRPIICYLPINPAFIKYKEKDNYPNSSFLNDNGFYVGLNKDLKEKDIDKLIDLLNKADNKL